MTDEARHGWILYSPALPAGVDPPVWGASLGVGDAEANTDGFHEGGWFLPEAASDGWSFGVSQSRLSNGAVHAFLRLPSQEEVSVLCDPHSSRTERLPVPLEPGYLGAYRVVLNPPPKTREGLVAGLLALLPELRAAISANQRAAGT